MVALFFSCVCDYCDGKIEAPKVEEGFVVVRDGALPRDAYVFRTRSEAELWKTTNNLSDYAVRRVLSPARFTWRESTGSLKGITTADRLITIYPDHKFPPGPARAYLTQEDPESDVGLS